MKHYKAIALIKAAEYMDYGIVEDWKQSFINLVPLLWGQFNSTYKVGDNN